MLYGYLRERNDLNNCFNLGGSLGFSLFFREKNNSYNEGDDYMILFTILALILIILLVVVIAITSVIGAGTILVFGDVIVLILILGWIIYKLFFKNK